MTEVKFENKAWEEATFPRLVSNKVRKDGKDYIFVIGFHHPKRKYYLEIQETRNPDSPQLRETYGKTKLFSSIDRAKEFVGDFLSE